MEAYLFALKIFADTRFPISTANTPNTKIIPTILVIALYFNFILFFPLVLNVRTKNTMVDVYMSLDGRLFATRKSVREGGKGMCTL